MEKFVFAKRSLKFLVFVMMISLSSSVKAQDIEKNKDKLPEFSWDTMPLYMHVRKGTAFTNKELKYLSRFPLITFEKTTGSQTYGSTDKGTIMAAKGVKELNPDAKILYYKNVVINWAGYESDKAFFKEHPDAYLMDKKGGKASMPRGKTGFFDLSKDYVREYWLDHVGEVVSSPYIDGVFMDANIKVLAPGFFGNRSGKEKQKEVLSGYLTMMQDLKTR